MKCPYCKSEDTAVIDTRMSDDGASVRRRRECEHCAKRFTTYERIELGMPAVVKTSGYRTAYDREKMRTGFMRALHKRRSDRAEAAVSAAMADLIAAARSDANMIPPMIAAAAAEATLGEICDALRTEWGGYFEAPAF